MGFSWNNGKEVPRLGLDLTSSTTPGQQIHKFDHTQTANPCDWLPCRRAALPLVGCPHSLVYLHIPVVEGLLYLSNHPSVNLLPIIPCCRHFIIRQLAQKTTSSMTVFLDCFVLKFWLSSTYHYVWSYMLHISPVYCIFFLPTPGFP